MARVESFKNQDIDSSSVYLFEGGMVRDHRTKDAQQLTNKIRLCSLFSPHILVHSGNIFEEESLFQAITNDIPLLERGQLVPILRNSTDTLEAYGARWGAKYARRDPSAPAFFQCKPITAANVADIERRIEFFSKTEYRPLILPPNDRADPADHFIASVERLLSGEPSLGNEVKDAILSRARAASSPIGLIRYEVLRGYWHHPVYGEAARRLARRINIAYFGSGAQELNTRLSMNALAFRDMRAASSKRGPMVSSELLELSVSKALNISPTMLGEIEPDDFAAVLDGPEVKRFRKKVEATLKELNRETSSSVRASLGTVTRKSVQTEIDEDFRDTYSSAFAKAIRKRRSRERQVSRWVIGGSLFGLGVATDIIAGTMALPPPSGTVIGTAAAVGADAIVKPRITPVVMLQERLNEAIDRSKS